MKPLICIFDTDNTEFFMKFWTKAGYAPFYDAKHGKDYIWLKEQITQDHRFYTMESGKVYQYSVDDLEEKMYWSPDFYIGVADDQEFRHWNRLLEEIRECISENKNCSVLKHYLDPPNVAKAILDGELVTSTGPKPVDQKEGYSLRTYYIEQNDTMLYEVKRPNTELPFTVVVSPWKVKGDEYFFSDIYGSVDWDYNRIECRFDYLFLQYAWTEKFNLSGEFTMNHVKNRIDRCYPSEGKPPEPEPILYRRSIEGTIDALAKKLGRQAHPLPDFIKKD